MENIEYYSALAERIFLKGISAKEVVNFAKYRPSKSFKDLEEAVCRGRLAGLGKFENERGCIARGIYEVLEIDTKAFDKTYGIPDVF